MASDLTSQKQFGFSVAVNHDTVVVGAPFDGRGSAYVLHALIAITMGNGVSSPS